MVEKRKFMRFEMSLKADLDKGLGKTMDFSRFGLKASLDLTDKRVSVGDTIHLKISMPDRHETIGCEGRVRYAELSNSSWIIGVEIVTMDPGAKSDLLELAYKAWGKKRHENV